MSQQDYKHLVHAYRQHMTEHSGDIIQIQGTQQWNWQQLQHETDLIASALLEENVSEQENIGLFSSNSVEWSWVDIACQSIRAVTVPIYATSTTEQLQYIIDNASVRLLFVGNKQQLKVAQPLLEQCSSLQKIIVLNPLKIEPEHFNQQILPLREFCKNELIQTHQDTLKQRINAANLDDTITIIYTSGTTGQPKGVVLDHRNIAASIALHRSRVWIDKSDLSLSFLPLAHIYERIWTWYALNQNCSVAYCTDPARIQKSLASVRPTIMCSVPRLYEKIYNQVHSKAKSASFLKRIIFNSAIAIGRQIINRQQQQKPINPLLKSLNQLADKMVFCNIRQALGGRIRFMPSAGAALDPNINIFFHAAGINVINGYGMTETCATVCCRDEKFMPFNSCGTAVNGIEVKIGANKELLIKSPTVMRGYYKNPEATAETIIDGWLHTGDAAKIVDGNIIILERIKNLIKTTNGKYIAPQYIESKLIQEQMIDQITVLGDDQQYVSALIVPCFDTLENFAHKKGILYKNRLELVANSEVIKHFKQRIDTLQKELASHEKVKKFTLLSESFSIAKNEITPTFKVKRKVVIENFKKEISAMYHNAKSKK